MKGSILEGAVHCAAAIWSPHLQQNVVLSNLMHLSDWVPTFNHIAGSYLYFKSDFSRKHSRNCNFGMTTSGGSWIF